MAVCYNVQGWGNFSHNALGINSNVCKLHATSDLSVYCNIPALELIQWLAATSIVASHFSDVRQIASLFAQCRQV
jgi:hypothetical protein